MHIWLYDFAWFYRTKYLYVMSKQKKNKLWLKWAKLFTFVCEKSRLYDMDVYFYIFFLMLFFSNHTDKWCTLTLAILYICVWMDGAYCIIQISSSNDEPSSTYTTTHIKVTQQVSGILYMFLLLLLYSTTTQCDTK